MTLLALQQDFRAWLTAEPAEVPAQLREQGRAGLAVYLNNYRSQLMSCLSASFPITRAWLGDTAFDGAGAHHIERVPPHEWTLDAYGVGFPETLASVYPADPEIAELASLEWALAVAFVGPDADAVEPHTRSDIDWSSAVIRLVPTFTMVPVAMNVAAIWSAINDHETPPAATRLPEPGALAIWRDQFVPRFRTATAEEAAVLAQVRAGKTFGDLCAALVERVGEEKGTVIAGSFLSQWLSDGLIAQINSSAAPATDTQSS